MSPLSSRQKHSLLGWTYWTYLKKHCIKLIKLPLNSWLLMLNGPSTLLFKLTWNSIKHIVYFSISQYCQTFSLSPFFTLSKWLLIASQRKYKLLERKAFSSWNQKCPSAKMEVIDLGLLPFKSSFFTINQVPLFLPPQESCTLHYLLYSESCYSTWAFLFQINLPLI